MPVFPRHCILRVIICLSREGFSLGNICGVILLICLKEGDGGRGDYKLLIPDWTYKYEQKSKYYLIMFLAL